jgi:hypothetical protein
MLITLAHHVITVQGIGTLTRALEHLYPLFQPFWPSSGPNLLCPGGIRLGCVWLGRVWLGTPSASRNEMCTWHPSDVCASVSQPARASADSDDTHRRDNTCSSTLPADSLRCRGVPFGPFLQRGFKHTRLSGGCGTPIPAVLGMASTGVSLAVVFMVVIAP